MRLQAPSARTMGEGFGMGVRNVMTGAGGLVDIVAAPVNATVNAVTGLDLSTSPGRDLAAAGADVMGLARPESDTEKLNAAIIEGGAQGLLTAGAALPLAGATGATGAVARTLTASPLLDTVSGATSGAAQETARQAGAGPVGQLVAGLAGGMVPVGMAGAGARLRAPKSLPEVVEQTPRAAVIDETGNLTPHGQEVAARHGVSPEEVVSAYEAPPNVQRGVANDQSQPAVAREATNDLPIERVQEAPPMRTDAPTEAAPPPAAMPDAAPIVATPDTVPATAKARVEQANEFGVDISRGQATKSFDAQDAEMRLRNSSGPEAEEMRQFAASQVEQVKGAAERFKSAFGDTKAPAPERGEAVQEAIRELRDLGQKGVNELYKQARELGAPVAIEPTPIRNAFERVMVEADIPDNVKAVIKQEAARYGIIGKPEIVNKETGAVTSEAGITTVRLDDGERVKFYGEPQPLRLDNADAFRTIVSKQYPNDGPLKLSQVLKKAIDDAVEETAKQLAEDGDSNVSAKLKEARTAVQTQKKTFNAKDIVQSIADWKKGAQDVTGALKPEQVMQRALASTSDLKRVKAVLLSKPTVKSKAAWRAIQAHGVAQIFDSATTRTTNIGGEITEAISGAKLRTAIEKFGPDKLKVLLDPEEFNTLMKLRRVIEDVSTPISGTVNYSNTGNLIWRLLGNVENRVTAAFAAAGTVVGGPVGAAIGANVGQAVGVATQAAKEAKATARTLEDATNYTPEKAAMESEAAPKPSVAAKAKAGASKSVRAFIDIYGSPRILAPVLASAEGEE
jgi:hypothetical protein